MGHLPSSQRLVKCGTSAVPGLFGLTCTQDPEGILAQPEGGHINKRIYFKKVMSDKAFLAQARAFACTFALPASK